MYSKSIIECDAIRGDLSRGFSLLRIPFLTKREPINTMFFLAFLCFWLLEIISHGPLHKKSLLFHFPLVSLSLHDLRVRHVFKRISLALCMFVVYVASHFINRLHCPKMALLSILTV